MNRKTTSGIQITIPPELEHYEPISDDFWDCVALCEHWLSSTTHDQAQTIPTSSEPTP
jgi:hypothetical protein